MSPWSTLDLVASIYGETRFDEGFLFGRDLRDHDRPLPSRGGKSGLVDPLGKKNVGLPLDASASIAGKNQVFPIAAEHREPVELGVEGDLLGFGTVVVDHPQVEISCLAGRV